MEVDSKRTILLECCVPEVVSGFHQAPEPAQGNTGASDQWLLPCGPHDLQALGLYTVLVDFELWIDMSMSPG